MLVLTNTGWVAERKVLTPIKKQVKKNTNYVPVAASYDTTLRLKRRGVSFTKQHGFYFKDGWGATK